MGRVFGARMVRSRRAALRRRSRKPLITSRLMRLYYYISSSVGPMTEAAVEHSLFECLFG